MGTVMGTVMGTDLGTVLYSALSIAKSSQVANNLQKLAGPAGPPARLGWPASLANSAMANRLAGRASSRAECAQKPHSLRPPYGPSWGLQRPLGDLRKIGANARPEALWQGPLVVSNFQESYMATGGRPKKPHRRARKLLLTLGPAIWRVLGLPPASL